MGPIFNEKVAKKWNLWVLWTVHGTHWCVENGLKSQIMRLLFMINAWTIAVCLLKHVPKKKKKKKKCKTQNARRQTRIQTHA